MLSTKDLCLWVSSSINNRAASQAFAFEKPSVHLPSVKWLGIFKWLPLALLVSNLGSSSLIRRCNHVGWSLSIFGCIKWKKKKKNVTLAMHYQTWGSSIYKKIKRVYSSPWHLCLNSNHFKLSSIIDKIRRKHAAKNCKFLTSLSSIHSHFSLILYHYFQKCALA